MVARPFRNAVYRSRYSRSIARPRSSIEGKREDRMRIFSAMASPLILLHGLGTGPSGWLPQLAAFPQAVAPPLADAEPLMDELAAPFDLCGLSLGALAAL